MTVQKKYQSYTTAHHLSKEDDNVHVDILVYKWLYVRIFKRNHVSKYLWKVFKVNNYYAFIFYPIKYFIFYSGIVYDQQPSTRNIYIIIESLNRKKHFI